MSVHFFYNYRDELVKKLKEYYEDDVQNWKVKVAQQRQMDEAEMMIRKYFDALGTELKDVIDASGNEISLTSSDDTIVEFKIKENFVRFTRQERAIQVKIGYYVSENSMLETVILGYILPGEKRAVMKKVGKIHDGSTFDENTINFYLRTAFRDWIQNIGSEEGEESV